MATADAPHMRSTPSISISRAADARHRRGVRVRQDRHVAGDDGPPAAGPAEDGAMSFEGGICRRLSDQRFARSARQPHRDDLPGADDLAQSGYDRRSDRRGARSPSQMNKSGGAQGAVEMLRHVGIPIPEQRAMTIRTSFPAACASAS